MIPRVIHRVWMGAEMPAEFADFHADWARLNPGWEVIEWSDQDLAGLGFVNADLIERAAELCPERYIPRFRSNLIRYELLHRFGGVYADCDLRPLAPLPDLTGVEAFAGWEQQNVWIGNTILGSTPGHPFFGALIDGAAASCERYGPERSPITTGPQYLTRTYVERERADGSGLTVFPEPVFYPRSWRDLKAGKPPADLPPEAVTDHLWAALRGSVSVIIPYRPDRGHRDRNLAWVLERLRAEHPDWQIVIEEDTSTGLFNRAALIAAGVARSFGDVLVIHDADVWVPGLPDAVDRVRGRHRWAIPHTKVHRLTEAATVDVLDGGQLDTDLPCDEQPYTGVMAGGALVLTRDTFHVVPPDDRFAGWGGEDAAWGKALLTLAGAVWRSDQPLYHLWHPPQPRKTRAIGNDANEALLRRYVAAAGNKRAMRALIDRVEAAELDDARPEWQRWQHTSGRVRLIRRGSRGERTVASSPDWQPTG